MSKFKQGDNVVYTKQLDDIPELDFLKRYVVSSATSWQGNDYVYLFGIPGGYSYHASYFEYFEEWQKHQAPADAATELELAKIQIKMLQDSRNKAIGLLSRAATCLEDSYRLKLAEEIEKFLGEE